MSSDDTEFFSRLLRAYLDSANDAIFVLCNELKFLVCNPLMAEWIGLSEDELTAHNRRRPITELLGSREVTGRFRRAAEKVLKGEPQRFECYITPERGEARWIEISMKRVDVEAGDMIITVARDTTERREQLTRIHYQSTHDALTGLPNREYLLEQLQLPGERGGGLALLVVDLASFRDVNEALGHDVADEVLKTVGVGLQAAVADCSGCTVCRLAGDQFAILCSGSAAAQADEITRRVQDWFARPVRQSGFDLALGYKIGRAVFPQQVGESADLLRSAEVALYEAKSHPTTRVECFTPELSRRGDHRLSLLNDLNAAVGKRQLEVHLQPIVCLRGGLPRLEALARWKHPDKGDIPPGRFIPLAEASGLIVAVTRLIMERTLEDSAGLVRERRVSTVSVNISPHCLLDPDFVSWVADMIGRYGIAGHQLMLEITEGVAMSERMQKYSVVALKDLGVQVSIDDFGTGHSSLSKLRQLPVTELKIDRSFVKNMLEVEDDEAIVRATIHLAHSLKLDVVAEGIENEQTLQRLRQMGCDFAQGLWLCEPLPLSQLQAWLDVHRGEC